MTNQLQILTRKNVQRMTGLPLSTLHELVVKGEFPAPIPLNGRNKGWLESEVAQWLLIKAEKRGGVRHG